MMDAVIRALVGLLASIELSDDDVVDPEVAASWLEDVAAELDSLSEGDRERLAGLIRDTASFEMNPERRTILAELPEGLGLEGED